MKTPSAVVPCVQIGASLSDAAAPPTRVILAAVGIMKQLPQALPACAFVREHQPERGPVPSTSVSGNARRNRSLRRCRIRSASVSGWGPVDAITAKDPYSEWCRRFR